MNLDDIRQSYIDDGLDYENASSRAAQEVVLGLISSSPLANRVTIKGGIVLQNLSQDNRRATQDIDFDFLRYSIADDSIRQFVDVLNSGGNEFSITIVGQIKEMKHQDYNGKRVHVHLHDKANNVIATKLDMGVHKELSFEQAPLYFDLSKLDQGVTLLANSREQIVAEKMKSLLRIGAASTRFKDVFDIYYFINEGKLDEDIFHKTFEALILNDESMPEQTMSDVHARLSDVLHNKRFAANLSNAKNNWLQLPVDDVIDEILEGLRVLIRSERARRLAALGGSDPNAAAPPRRQFEA